MKQKFLNQKLGKRMSHKAFLQKAKTEAAQVQATKRKVRDLRPGEKPVRPE
ncbi:MAG TPA: hypothetical protein VI699_02630 [Candidatus Acidoferrales bacterium]|nr:hypothetical protein [Candidatus Acidoferrales bacterium]